MTLPPSTQQSNYLWSLVRELRLSEDALDRLSEERFGKPQRKLDRRETSQVIGQLEVWRDNRAALLRWLGVVPMFDLEGVA